MAKTKQTARKMSENNPLCRKIDVLNMTMHNIFEMLATSGYENAKIFADNKIVDAKIVPLITQGLFSQIYKVQFFNENPEKPFFTAIIKKPTTEKFDGMAGEGGFDVNLVKSFHNNECNFYQMFTGNIHKFLPKPKVFSCRKFKEGSDENGFILMEDLSERTKVYDVLESMSKEQVEAVVDSLAIFHNDILLYGSEFWQNKFNNCAYITIHNIVMPEMTEQTLNKLKQLRPGVFDDLLKKLHRIIYETELVQFCVTGCCEEIGAPLVICHGDLWNNNILWHTNEDDSVSNRLAAFIDYHYACQGNPAYDFTRLIVFGCDPDVRHEIEETIFDFYMQKLTAYMGERDEKPNFMAEQLKKAYGYSLCHMAWLCCLHAIFYPTNQTDALDKEALEKLQEKLVLRAKAALEDAVKFLKKEKPEWLL